MTAKPIDGALEILQQLQKMGYRFVVVTARHPDEKAKCQDWLTANYPGNYVVTGFLFSR